MSSLTPTVLIMFYYAMLFAYKYNNTVLLFINLRNFIYLLLLSLVLFQDLKQNERQSLPVLMPGDKVPKFIALPCPCEPPREEKVVVKVTKPPKPPRMPVPLY